MAEDTIFEEQFRSFSGVTNRSPFDTALRKKWDFLQCCIDMKDLGSKSNKMATLSSSKTMQRKDAYEILHGLQLDILGTKHRPEKLEQSILDAFQFCNNIDLTTKIACLDCSNKCKHNPGIHLYVCWSSDISATMDEFLTIASSTLEKKHQVHLVETVFLSKETIPKTENDIVMRFDLRDNMDQLMTKRLYMYTNKTTEITKMTVQLKRGNTVKRATMMSTTFLMTH